MREIRGLPQIIHPGVPRDDISLLEYLIIDPMSGEKHHQVIIQTGQVDTGRFWRAIGKYDTFYP